VEPGIRGRARGAVRGTADPEELLEELNNAEAEVAAIRDQLKAILSQALLR